jgi:hypothetical protein
MIEIYYNRFINNELIHLNRIFQNTNQECLNCAYKQHLKRLFTKQEVWQNQSLSFICHRKFGVVENCGTFMHIR